MFNKELVSEIEKICNFKLSVFKENDKPYHEYYFFKVYGILALSIASTREGTYEYYFTNDIEYDSDKWLDMDIDDAEELINKLKDYCCILSIASQSIKNLETKYSLKRI